MIVIYQNISSLTSEIDLSHLPKIEHLISITLVFRQFSASLVVTSGELLFKNLKPNQLLKRTLLQVSNFLKNTCSNLYILSLAFCLHLCFKVPLLIGTLYSKVPVSIGLQRYHRICTGLAEKAFTFLTQVVMYTLKEQIGYFCGLKIVLHLSLFPGGLC